MLLRHSLALCVASAVLAPNIAHASFSENFTGTERVLWAGTLASFAAIGSLALGWRIGRISFAAQVALALITWLYTQSTVLYFEPLRGTTAVFVHHVANPLFLVALLLGAAATVAGSYLLVRRERQRTPNTARWKVYGAMGGVAASASMAVLGLAYTLRISLWSVWRNQAENLEGTSYITAYISRVLAGGA
jgi:hypothetical protein